MRLRSKLRVMSQALPLWLALVSLAATSLSGCADEPRARSASDAGAPSTSVAHTAPSPKDLGCSADELRRPAKRVIRGLSTYYADSLAGNRTSNGERYDPARLTAAHRSLPFGTRLRISRTDQKSSAVLCVVVNDRGPFGNRKYILDVSRRAAEALHMIHAGVVPLRIDVL